LSFAKYLFVKEADHSIWLRDAMPKAAENVSLTLATGDCIVAAIKRVAGLARDAKGEKVSKSAHRIGVQSG
jgi:hypothetical protein